MIDFENDGYYVGVDPSLAHTGVVVIDQDGKVVGEKLIETSPCENKDKAIRMGIDLDKRINYILSELKFLKNIMHLKGIYIEGLSYMSNGNSAAQLAGVHFNIRQFLYQNKIDFKIIPPKTLKKITALNGNATKELMMEMVEKRFGVKYTDDNLCDAYSLARLGFEEK